MAPAFFASVGMISGVGTARAKTMGSLAMLATMAAVTRFAAERPTRTSAPLSTSASEPLMSSALVCRAISAFTQFMLVGRYLWMAPALSHTMRWRAPAARRRRATPTPAEPAPLITLRASSRRFPTRGRALRSPASTMTPAPWA